MKVGDRVQLNPAMDCWMAGDRYGEIVDVHRWVVESVAWHMRPVKHYRVKLDKSGRTVEVHPDNIYEVL